MKSLKSPQIFKTLFLAICFLSTMQAHAQIRPGVKAGVTIPVSPNTNSIIVNRQSPENEFLFNTSSVGNGICLGVFAEKHLKKHFFLRGELMYTRFETTYELNLARHMAYPASHKQSYIEKTTYLDIPVSLGVWLENFEVTSGLIARYVMRHGNEMADMPGYEEASNQLQLGFQAGVGVNLGNLNIGMSYQLDFTNYGDHMLINGNALTLHNRPSRLVVTIGYRI